MQKTNMQNRHNREWSPWSGDDHETSSAGGELLGTARQQSERIDSISTGPEERDYNHADYVHTTHGSDDQQVSLMGTATGVYALSQEVAPMTAQAVGSEATPEELAVV